MVTENVNTENLKSYQDLAKPEFKGQICIRSSSNIYNQSLAAALIEHQGKAATETWAKGIVDNMARRPQGGDRDQIRAAAAGQCSIVVANTYYLGAMLGEGEGSKDYEAASKLKVIWPNQTSTGTHVNVSGAGMLKNAPNKANAIKFIEFLSSDAAQEIYADRNFEYPIRDNIETNAILEAWGNFKADKINLSLLGTNNAEAVKAMDKAGWK
jgi:iron(III) transport system substrate-binding protein